MQKKHITNFCPHCGFNKVVIATYKNGAKWLECEKCFTAIQPLNEIAKNN